MAGASIIQQAPVDAGPPAEEFIVSTAEPAIKQQLVRSTPASVERGTFGSSTFFVGKEIFFGKDKLRDVE